MSKFGNFMLDHLTVWLAVVVGFAIGAIVIATVYGRVSEALSEVIAAVIGAVALLWGVMLGKSVYKSQVKRDYIDKTRVHLAEFYGAYNSDNKKNIDLAFANLKLRLGAAVVDSGVDSVDALNVCREYYTEVAKADKTFESVNPDTIGKDLKLLIDVMYTSESYNNDVNGVSNDELFLILGERHLCNEWEK